MNHHHDTPETRPPHPHEGAVREIPTRRTATILTYAPERDGLADAGEVVWTWVPFAEDPAVGKDRPLLVVGRKDGVLHALMLSSQEPDDWEEQDWLLLGSGAWDHAERVSYVRLDRLFELEEHSIRREGATVDADTFWRVAEVLRERYGWR